MSSYKLGLFQKHASDETSSDDSNPPAKKLRVCNGETSTFPSRLFADEEEVETIAQIKSKLPGYKKTTIHEEAEKNCESDRQQDDKFKFCLKRVVRLEEKAVYQLLIDKMVSGSSPMYRPLKPIKEGSFTIDLTEDDHLDEPLRKEILKNPLQEFMEKFYKPYNYRPLSPKSHKRSSKASTAYNEEVVTMAKIKLPEYKPNPKKMPDFFSTDWMDDLKAGINEETEKLCESIKRQDVKLEFFWKKKRKEKLAEQSWLRDQLKLSSAIFCEAVEEKQEFPEETTG